MRIMFLNAYAKQGAENSVTTGAIIDRPRNAYMHSLHILSSYLMGQGLVLRWTVEDAGPYRPLHHRVPYVGTGLPDSPQICTTSCPLVTQEKRKKEC